MDAKQFLGRRRDRAIATILGEKERICDSYLPEAVSFEFRKVILDEINNVVDLAFDLIGSGGDFNNEYYLEMLESIHGMLENHLGSDTGSLL